MDQIKNYRESRKWLQSKMVDNYNERQVGRSIKKE